MDVTCSLLLILRALLKLCLWMLANWATNGLGRRLVVVGPMEEGRRRRLEKPQECLICAKLGCSLASELE